MKKVLTIAGSDCSGGAGIQADLKTFSAHKVYGMSVITALTAQNTMGVTGICGVTPEFVSMQLDAVFQDIEPDAVKIGMVSDEATIRVIVCKLKEYNAKNVVLDPVMIATSGSALLKEEAVDVLRKELMPLADIITPNIAEAEVLTGVRIQEESDMEQAARVFERSGFEAIVIKGGHSTGSCNDLYYEAGKSIWLCQKRIGNPNSHGTGCTLSSAIASNLAMGYSKEESVILAKHYVTKALMDMLDLGRGSGPLNHCVNL